MRGAPTAGVPNGRRRDMKRRTRWQLQSGVLAMALVVTACGGDEADPAAEGTPTTQATEGDTSDGTGTEAAAGEVDDAAFCDNWTELQATAGEAPPEETQSLAEAAAAAAPPEVAEAIQTEVELFSSGAEDFQEDPTFVRAEAVIDEHMFDVCEADTTIEFTGTEYAYDGVPDEVAAGSVKIRFTNEGAELHEAVHLVKKEGVTESWDELLELPEEEAMEKVDFVGGAFASPGNFDVGVQDWEAGEHILICFLPVGATPEAFESGEEPQGEPHFARGMRHEFVVQ